MSAVLGRLFRASFRAGTPVTLQQRLRASTAHLNTCHATEPAAFVPQLEERSSAGQSAINHQPRKARSPPVMVVRGLDFQSDVWQNAAILIDKPLRWTSFDVCGKLRGVLRTKKVGHAGTLDPGASGLLIICTGSGTKHIDNFVAQHKEYIGTLRLGEETLSFDADTEVCNQKPWEHITDAEMMSAAEAFLGETLQLPPMYSAIKVKGERLYKAARRGEEVQRPQRTICITLFELERDVWNPQAVHFRVACSKGTYIRSLVHDLGRALGSAAHMTSLRRTKIGDNNVANAWSIEELSKAVDASRL